ncbi:MAG: efflux RND transporter periplasmic adaptor subunit [Deltaproteobacteria bacterium]|nr:efflux RND transporter periplasmic adaptor subunit [Candidatus Anaeroferrophillacea bacterium]
MNMSAIHRYSRRFALLLPAVVCFVLPLPVPLAAIAADGPPAAPPPALVRTVPAEAGRLAPETTVTGTLFFDSLADVSAEISARVEAVHVRVGDRVAAGAPLVDLNHDFIDVDIARREAARDAVAARLEQARRDLKRYEQLHAEGAASVSTYEELLYCRDAQAAELRVQHAALDDARLRLKKCRVTAPFAALVVARPAAVGAWVDPGRAVARLGSLAEVFVRLPLAETLLPFNPAGSEIRLVHAASGAAVAGVVTGIDGQADLQTKNVFLRLHLSEPPALLAEHMSLTAAVAAGPPREVVFISRDALVNFQGGNFVYTVEDNAAAIVPVEIVGRDGGRVGVASPVLKPGMPVVVDGNERLRPGQPVRVAGNAAAAEQRP